MKMLQTQANLWRLKKYQTKTTFLQKGQNTLVRKEANNQESQSHIAHILSTRSLLPAKILTPKVIKATTQYIDYEFVDSPNLQNTLAQSLLTHNTSRADQIFTNFLNILNTFKSNSFKSQTNFDDYASLYSIINSRKGSFSDWIYPGILDPKPDNFVINQKQIMILDLEWIFPYSLPLDYVFYRVLLYTCASLNQLIQQNSSQIWPIFEFQPGIFVPINWWNQTNLSPESVPLLQQIETEVQSKLVQQISLPPTFSLEQFLQNLNSPLITKPGNFVSDDPSILTDLKNNYYSHVELLNQNFWIFKFLNTVYFSKNLLKSKLNLITTGDVQALRNWQKFTESTLNHQSSTVLKLKSSTKLRKTKNFLFAVNNKMVKTIDLTKKIKKEYQLNGFQGVYKKTLFKFNHHNYIDAFNKSYYLWHQQYADQLLNPTSENIPSDSPLISILTPVYNTNHDYLKAALDSVINQSYSNWELIVVNDSSSDPEIQVILKKIAKQDRRIKVYQTPKNQHICHATNLALEKSTGDFIALLDHDDVLYPHALAEVAKVISNNPKAKLIYSDEDKIAEDGVTYCDPFFKPNWSPHFMLACNYITHLAVLDAKIVKEINGFRPGTEGAQDWDLFLRFINKVNGFKHHPWQKDCPIIHIPKILYSWRKSVTSTASEKHAGSAKSYAYTSQVTVLQDAIDNLGGGQINHTRYIGLYETLPTVKGKALVSIIIPTKDNPDLLIKNLKSIYKYTRVNYEIVIVDTGSSKSNLTKYQAIILDNTRIIHWKKQFNFSKVCNFGASFAQGNYYLFLNDDVEILNSNWLTKMLSYAARPEVGAVGARLLYPDGKIQHNGLILGCEKAQVLGEQGFVSNYFRTADPNQNYGIPSLYLENIRNYTAVTAACLLIKKEKHELINGFDPSFKIAFNDVDYSLKLNQKGLFNVVIPSVSIRHYESASLGKPGEKNRDLTLFAQEIKAMHDKWGELIMTDSFWNPNLDLQNALPIVKSPNI